MAFFMPENLIAFIKQYRILGGIEALKEFVDSDKLRPHEREAALRAIGELPKEPLRWMV